MFTVVKLTFKRAENLLRTFNIEYYHYQPKTNFVTTVSASEEKQTKAVPVLMYHGVLSYEDQDNTEQNNFIQQMEMLKSEGYYTISLEQLDCFLNKECELFGKPIVITFDDGRKDSYYPTDDVLAKLGFKATLFYVSGKANHHDSFYLSWEELKRLKSSGRWDIHSHGELSHEKIVIDKNGNHGRFLSSRIFDAKTGLESVENFEKRVTKDYENNLADLRNKLGIESKYYAIPLNDYGAKMSSNYPESVEFNNNLLHKYYKLAFVEVNGGDGGREYRGNVYNYPEDDHWAVKRIEVKNQTAKELKEKLEFDAPSDPSLTYSGEITPEIARLMRLAYGDVSTEPGSIKITTEDPNSSAKYMFGNSHWSDYTTEIDLGRLRGDSTVLIAYSIDNNNYLSFGPVNDQVELRQMINGEEKLLRKPVELNLPRKVNLKLKLKIKNGLLSAFVNNYLIYKNVPISLDRGEAGIKVWGGKEIGEGLIKTIAITPTTI